MTGRAGLRQPTARTLTATKCDGKADADCADLVTKGTVSAPSRRAVPLQPSPGNLAKPKSQNIGPASYPASSAGGGHVHVAPRTSSFFPALGPGEFVISVGPQHWSDAGSCCYPSPLTDPTFPFPNQMPGAPAALGEGTGALERSWVGWGRSRSVHAGLRDQFWGKVPAGASQLAKVTQGPKQKSWELGSESWETGVVSAPECLSLSLSPTPSPFLRRVEPERICLYEIHA